MMVREAAREGLALVRCRGEVPVKFRDRSGNTWAGRGAMPVWLRDKIKAGAKLEDFAVDRTRAKGRKKRRKTKR